MDQISGKDPLSFWKRPEGKTGMVFAVLLGLAAVFGLYLALPFIVVLLQSLLYAILLGIAVVGLIFVILDRRMRGLIFNIYKSIMRFITGIFIEIDPIGIMKNYLDTLVDKREELNNQIAKVSGVKRRLEKIIGDNEKKTQESMQNASVAKKKNRERQVQIHTRSAARLQEVNSRMTPLKDRLGHLLEILIKVDEAVGTSIEDLSEEIKVTEMEFESMRAASKAMKQAVGALSGSGVDYEFFERAKEYVEKDVGEKVGQIDNYLRISSSIMENLDFKDEVALDKGMAMLEQWEKTGTFQLSGEESISAASSTGEVNSYVAGPEKIKNVFDNYREQFKSGD